MYIKCSIGFLIASLSQVGVIFLAEKLSISSLGIKITGSQILLHVLAGLVAGFLLLFLARKLEFIEKLNYWLMGTVYGLIVWAVIVPIQVSVGNLNAPWNQNTETLVTSLAAFVLYGIITAFTVKAFGLEKVKA